MDPQQQQPLGPYPPSDNSPYQFIMEPPKKTKRTSGLSGNPFIMKLLLLVGGGVALLIVGAIIVNTLFAPKTNLADIIAIVQTEQELIRVSSQGNAGADISTRNVAISTQLALTTQQQIWLNFLAQHKHKVAAKDLALKKNAATDAQLTQAKATSTFDGTFKTILRSQLEAYNISLKDAADNAGESQEKAALLSQYNQVLLLLQQLPQQ